MKTLTIKEFQERFDELIGRVENGEQFEIVNEKGQTVVMIPADDDFVRIHTEENNEAS